MKVFTYHQYIRCIHTLRLNMVLRLAEESEDYHLKRKEEKPHNLIKNIFTDREEVAQFINGFLYPKEKVKAENLVPYANYYRNKKHNMKKADLVYQVKGQDMFFLIEQQDTVDDNMPYRILNYCLDLIQEWNRNKKTGYPVVVPIIIYLGEEPWKIDKKEPQTVKNLYQEEGDKTKVSYNFIDIQKIPKQILLEKDTVFGYMMFMEKVFQAMKEKMDSKSKVAFYQKMLENKRKIG